MTTLFETGRRETGDGGGDRRQDVWERTIAGWFDPSGAGESAFLAPGRPAARRRTGATLQDTPGALDLRVIETVRRRALGGDPRAQSLTFRAARGIARPVDLTARPSESGALPPEIAAVMIEAGLAAIHAFTEEEHDPTVL